MLQQLQNGGERIESGSCTNQITRPVLLSPCEWQVIQTKLNFSAYMQHIGQNPYIFHYIFYHFFQNTIKLILYDYF